VNSQKKTAATEDLHFRVLKLIQDQPEITQRQLADRLGISHGKLNYCLRALIDKGMVKLSNFANSSHRFGYVYLLTPGGIAEKAALTGRFLQRKVEEFNQLKVEIEKLEAELKEGASITNVR
jgi:EPS-associated MarR family transcriptional regulator